MIYVAQNRPMDIVMVQWLTITAASIITRFKL